MSAQQAQRFPERMTSGEVAATDAAGLADCSQDKPTQGVGGLGTGNGWERMDSPVALSTHIGVKADAFGAGAILPALANEIAEESATLDLHALYAALCFERVVEHAQKWGSR